MTSRWLCRLHRLPSEISILFLMCVLILFLLCSADAAQRSSPSKAPAPAPAITPPAPVRILVVATESEAKNALDLVKSGKAFEALVRERSIGPEKERGGYLGRVDPSTLSPGAAAALANTQPGAVSAVFRTENGFGILQVLTDKEQQEIEARVRRDEAVVLLQRGVDLGRAGDLEGAAGLLRQAVERDATLANAYYNLAIAYRRLGRTDEAVQSMREAVRLQPKDFDGFMRLGDWLSASGKTAEAIRMYEQAALAQMDSQEAWRALAKAYETTGRDRAALEAYRRVLGLVGGSEVALVDPYLRLAFKLKDGPAAVDAARRIQTLRPNHEAFQILGDALLLNNEPEAALREYQKGILLAPNSVQGHLGLGKAYAKLGQFEPAAEHLLKVVQLEPDHAEYYQLLSATYDQMGRLDLAIVALRDGVAAASSLPAASQADLVEYLAGLYEQAGMSREAELQRERAKALRVR